MEEHRKTAGLFEAALAAMVLLLFTTRLKAQSVERGFRMMSSADSNAVTTMAEEGVPERGRFIFIYSYDGEAIGKDLYMDITLNGTPLVNFTSLAPVSYKKVVDKVIKKGDKIEFYEQ